MTTRHGPHQVAQKSSNMTWPRSVAIDGGKLPLTTRRLSRSERKCRRGPCASSRLAKAWPRGSRARLLFARADVADVDRGADGIGRDGTNDVLPARTAVGADAKDAITLSDAGLLGGRTAHDMPDSHALPRVVGVHGHAQPGSNVCGLRRASADTSTAIPGAPSQPRVARSRRGNLSRKRKRKPMIVWFLAWVFAHPMTSQPVTKEPRDRTRSSRAIALRTKRRSAPSTYREMRAALGPAGLAKFSKSPSQEIEKRSKAEAKQARR